MALDSQQCRSPSEGDPAWKPFARRGKGMDPVLLQIRLSSQTDVTGECSVFMAGTPKREQSRTLVSLRSQDVI